METRHQYANPTVSPFVRWGPAGYAVFPPNTIYEVATEIIEALQLDRNALDGLCTKRIQWATIGGAHAIHPDATWDKVILGFLRALRDERETSQLYPLAIQLVSRMLVRPAREAWASVSGFIVEHIDELSGWSREARHLGGFLGANAGAVRMNHLVNTLGQPFGQARHFLRLFSLFALADDFRERDATYPRALRFALYLDSDMFSGRWQFRFLDQIRSVRWRPDSNYADDQWLAQSLVARLVDDLDRDAWLERIQGRGTRPIELEPEYRWQADYALETRLLIGDEPDCYFEFEGRTVRWINPTPENRAMLTIGCADRENAESEHNLVGRLLSLLTWEHHAPIRIEDFTRGARRALPWVSMTRAGHGHVQAYEPGKYVPALSPETWELLALYREAECADSVYYRFLCYWKVIELALKDRKQREEWVNDKVAEYHEPGVVEALRSEQTSFFKYLAHWGRNAVAHADREPKVKPDEWRDFGRFSRDVWVVRWLAETLLRERYETDAKGRELAPDAVEGLDPKE